MSRRADWKSIRVQGRCSQSEYSVVDLTPLLKGLRVPYCEQGHNPLFRLDSGRTMLGGSFYAALQLGGDAKKFICVAHPPVVAPAVSSLVQPRPSNNSSQGGGDVLVGDVVLVADAIPERIQHRLRGGGEVSHRVAPVRGG